MESVSYTHLDVYKRQLPEHRFLCHGFNWLHGEEGGRDQRGRCHPAVPALRAGLQCLERIQDVYKRQVPGMSRKMQAEWIEG